MKSIHILFFGLTIKPIVGVNDFFPQIGEITSTDTKQKINDAEPCGESFCYHGSKCLAGINIGNGTTEDICDCTSAFTDTQAYAGEFCQYPSTDFCGDPAFGSNRNFCVNNGVCESSGYAPCQCPNGFKGPRCAFEVGKDGVEYSECKLKCENGATCQKGLKKADLGKYARFADDISHLINETHTHVDFEHCVCPPGYFGISCEYEVEECGKGDHFCFHGSTCSEDETNCDCESSDFDTAGLFCENASTEECPEESFLPDDKHRGFCVNGGKCNLKEDGALQCVCPLGYEGPHCEYKMRKYIMQTSGRDIDPTLTIFCIFISMIISSTWLLIYYRIKKTKLESTNSFSIGRNENIHSIAPDNAII